MNYTKLAEAWEEGRRAGVTEERKRITHMVVNLASGMRLVRQGATWAEVEDFFRRQVYADE